MRMSQVCMAGPSVAWPMLVRKNAMLSPTGSVTTETNSTMAAM